MRRASQSAFANPVLVGAVTVLAVLVALFLAYNANQGLPFVPTKELKVNLADGANLIAGNDVREGGFRIGLVSQLKPVPLANGQTGAQVTLKLDKAHGNIPIDSHITILSRSVLGLKYIDLVRGVSSTTFRDGDTIPARQTTVPVQFDDIFKTFDTRTRVAIQRSLTGSGDVLAGRGGDLNDTIHSLPQLLTSLQSVAHYLAQPGNGLVRFFNSLNSFMSAVAPVAQTQVRLFGEAATTFQAIARDPNALQQSIAQAPSTLATGTDSLRSQQPFLVDLTTLGQNLAPATASLNAALPNINPAIEQGTRTLIRTPALNSRLQGVMTALKNLAQAPGTNTGINGLRDTVGVLNPLLRYLGPYQTVCDYWNYWWTYFADHVSQQTGFGFAQRALLNTADAPTNPFSVGGLFGATAPVNGNAGSDTAALSNLQGGKQFLHAQPYGAAIDTHGNADCETGQRGFVKQLNHLDPLGRMLATDPHIPGNQGPTFNGLAHVPTGETFSRTPLIGPQVPYIPQNP